MTKSEMREVLDSLIIAMSKVRVEYENIAMTFGMNDYVTKSVREDCKAIEKAYELVKKEVENNG